MKKMTKLIVVLMTAVMIVASVGVMASAQAITLSFSDVPGTHWAYTTITNMTKMGLFRGVKDAVNGVGEFMPEKTMTRAEFITVSLRAIYPEEAQAIENQAGEWWRGYYEMALDKGILFPSELGKGKLDEAMTRQEMAMVMVRCVEKNGEKAPELVATDRIADYWSITENYRLYVRKCFSLGLICGMDAKGTFAPSMSLTRAQAATVLCRLVDKSARILVEDEVSEQELPWENGGKQPEDYTLEEFNALTEEQILAFIDSFESSSAFDKWLEKAMGAANALPWENGGKQPKDYTWEEYVALTNSQQDAFRESFGSDDAFEAWLLSVQINTDNSSELPWENGGKQPKDYTWEEFSALSDAEMDAFIASFGDDEAFNDWLKKVQGSTTSNHPWENGGKQPKDYTWEEFCALSEDQMKAFVDSFGSDEEFNKWLLSVQK